MLTTRMFTLFGALKNAPQESHRSNTIAVCDRHHSRKSSGALLERSVGALLPTTVQHEQWATLLHAYEA